VSFEERFAAAGRAIDGMLLGIRDRMRPSSSRRRIDWHDIKDAASSRVSHACDQARDIAGGARSHILSEEQRGRWGVAALAAVCIVLTAIITWRLAAGTGGGIDQNQWEMVQAIAASRDEASTGGAAAPRPIRAERIPPRR
jgi:hypothetical protein